MKNIKKIAEQISETIVKNSKDIKRNNIKIALPKNEIKSLLSDHEEWLKNPQDGKQIKFKHNELKRQDFGNAKLDKAEFLNCNLSGSNFKNSSLKNAKFNGSDLEYCDFLGADYDTADFSNCKNFDAHKQYVIREIKKLGYSDRELNFAKNEFNIVEKNNVVTLLWDDNYAGFEPNDDGSDGDDEEDDFDDFDFVEGVYLNTIEDKYQQIFRDIQNLKYVSSVTIKEFNRMPKNSALILFIHLT
jgi:hypothetical protein